MKDQCACGHAEGIHDEDGKCGHVIDCDPMRQCPCPAYRPVEDKQDEPKPDCICGYSADLHIGISGRRIGCTEFDYQPVELGNHVPSTIQSSRGELSRDEDDPVKVCPKCKEEHVDRPWYPKHQCGVCPGPCTLCEGLSHHWMEHQDDDNDDLFYWSCKHCSVKVPYNEPAKHPEGCDCPDHQDEDDE